MANRRREQTGYRKLELQNTLADGLIPSGRQGGELEAKVASAFFRLAGHYGAVADEEAIQAGTRAGARAALDGASAPVSSAPPSSSSSEGSSLAGTPSDAGAYVRDRLVSQHGFTPQAAAAFAGHAQAESNFDVNAVGDKGTSYGLMQWRNERAEALKRFAAARGTSWKDLDTQIDFGVHELSTSEAYAGAQLRNARTVQEGVTALMHFERPQGYTRANPQNGHNYAGRLSFAMAYGPNGSVPAEPQGRPSVPAAVQAPGVVATNTAGNWKPSGGKTLFERSYDAAGIRTYLQMADADMRADQMRVYQAFKDDPVRLREGMDALLKLHLDPKQGHVFPEIEADYRVAFMKNRVAYELQADRDAEQLRIQQDQAEFLQRTNELSTNISQLQAQITDDNPLAPQMILDAQTQLDAHYDDAVERKLMTPVAAEKAKIDARREAALGFYGRQADALDADGVKQMRDEMAADFSAGNLPQLDGDGWEELDTHLQARERQKRAEDKQANAAYQKRGDQMLDRIAAGFDVDPAQLNDFRTDVESAPDGQAIMNRTLDNLRDARRVRDLPMREAEQLIQQEYEKLTPTSDQEQIDRWNLMSGVFKSKRKMLASDPIGYAENNGVIPKTGSVASIESADDLAGLIADRTANAGLIEDHYGVPARYFRPGEAAALQSLVEKQPSSILGVADALAGAGPEHAPKMLAEIARDAPVLSHVAGLLALTGDPTIAVEIGEGMRLAGMDGFKSRLPSAEKRLQAADETWGAALALKPETRYRAMKAADLLFERRIAAQGLDVSDFGTDGNVARDVYADALNAVLGATERGGVTYGGVTTVNGVETIAPPDMPADDLEGLVQDLTIEDLRTQGPIGKINGITMTVQQLRRAVLVYAGPGRYQMALGDPFSGDPRYVPAGDGGYFELDVDKLAAARPQSEKSYFRRSLDAIIPGLK